MEIETLDSQTGIFFKNLTKNICKCNCCIPAAQGLRGIGGDAGLKLYFMENRFLTPQKWKKYEKEAVKVAQDWIERAQYENEDWHYHIHLFAAKVYNRGDGLVFLYFNERTQQSGMTKEFKDWMLRILDGISRLPFY